MLRKSKFIWMNGNLINWEDAKIHVLSHSLHYGSAVFEGIRCYETNNGAAVFRLKEHTERLFYSASIFGMNINYTKDDVNKAVIETIKKNNLKSCYIRPIAFFGYGKMGLNPEGCLVNLSIAVWPWDSYLGKKPVTVKTSNKLRVHPGTTDVKAKISGNYQNSILASIEAKKAGYDEALLLDYKGNIAEGPGENIFIVKDGKLITPLLENILPGITRDSIIKIAENQGITLEEKILKLRDLYYADEAFFTGTAAEVVPILSVDVYKIKKAPGEITKKLRDIYLEIVHGKNEKYLDWLSFVK